MNDYDGMSPGQVLNDASVADFIKSLGLGIAEAQKALDINSVEQLDAFTQPIPALNNKSLLELGLQPAFYHFQHADLSCSLQLSLKVQKSFGVDFGIEAKYESSDSSKAIDESSLSQTESFSSERTQVRKAEVAIKHNSRGAVQVNGQSYSLSGQSLDERMNALAQAIRGNGAISQAIPFQQSTEISPPLREKPGEEISDEQVVFTPNSVAFLENRFKRGDILVQENPSSSETFRLNSDTAVTVEPQDNLKAYVDAVTSSINGLEGYSAQNLMGQLPPGTPLFSLYFAVGSSTPFSNSSGDKQITNENSEKETSEFINITARLIKEAQVRVDVVGHASRTGSEELNDMLSDARAKAVKELLVSSGATKNLIDIKGKGYKEAPGQEGENPIRRRVDIILSSDNHLILVNADDGYSINRDQVEPNKLNSRPVQGNGFTFVNHSKTLNNLNGKKILIKNEEFTLSGEAINGHEEDSAFAFATQLTQAVQTKAGFDVEASRRGHVVQLSNSSDETQLILLSESSQEINLSGSDGVTVKSNFTRTQTQSSRREREGNTTVAVGASLNVRYSRQFEMEITGNSSISARLASVPPPAEFVQSMQEILNAKKGGN